MSLVRNTRPDGRSRKPLARATAAIVETLEGRMLLHAGHLHVSVNFQPSSAPVPVGYIADAGLAYGDRGNGYNYGWDIANTTGTRDRNKTSDQRFDTLNHTQAYGERAWEIDVPNGQYNVRVVAGDPQYFDSVYKFDVENTLTVNGTPASGNRFIEGTKTVNVTDGRLTISNAAGSVNNKLAFVEIASAAPEQAQVSVTALDASAAEGGNSGSFRFTRSGDLTHPLVVTYNIAGTATNGIDYQQLLGTVTIPPGSATALVTITPIDDSAVESSETVVLSVLPGDGYDATPGSATVTIADNDAATAFNARINFQPASAPVPSGYLVDGGHAFSARGNGLMYGWSSDNTSGVRDRNKTSDQLYDTLNHFQDKSWELAVPNGTYSVRIVAGDPGYFDSIYRIDAEGVRVVDGTPTSANRFFDGAAVVTVNDGRLTLTSASGAGNNKINFIEISQADAQQKPTITVTAPSTNASENGPTSRSFTIARSGGTTDDLTVYFTIGGTATNGVDYGVINSPVIIPAGSASVSVSVNPIDDTVVESTETVTLTLVSQSGYTVGSASNSTIRINDNDSPVGNTIAWSTRASNPLGRAEALRAVVDGKLYVFGGFASTGPVNRHDVFDPATNTWSSRAALPTRLTHAGVAVDGRDIYVAGGYIGTSSSGWGQKFGVKDVWKYNVDTNQWTAVVALPKEVAGGGLTLLGRELHWVSGNNNQRQDIGDHYVLDLDNTSAGWKTAAALPLGRSHLGVLTLNGRIYAIGGQFGNDEALTTQKYVHVWDPASPASWTRLADLPTAISHIASATFVLGDRIVTAGGETGHTKPTDLVYAFDPLKNEWAAMTKLPAAQFSGVAAEIGGEIFFTTGSSQTTTWKGTVS